MDRGTSLTPEMPSKPAHLAQSLSSSDQDAKYMSLVNAQNKPLFFFFFPLQYFIQANV